MPSDRRAVLKGAAALAGWSLLPAIGRAEPSARITELIARMTIDEKAGQLSCYSDQIRPVGAIFNPVVNPASAEQQLADIAAGRIGMIFNGLGVAGARKAQAAALNSRLGIPLILAADILRGHTTIFPIPLAEAAAFDPDLAEASAHAIAREAAASGLHWTFAPMVDLARDQRWGRVAEGAGEDVYLASLYAAARTRGFQGEDLKRADTLAATPKHFAGYGATIGGMEYGEVAIPGTALRELHVPPFKAAIDTAAASVMTSFTSMDGVPATGDTALLTGMLREELGFTGVTVTDYDSDREMVAHGYAADEVDAARIAIMAGVDVSMQSGLFVRHLPALVADGRVPLARVDEAVARVLALKERLGLFDDPWRGMDARVERRVVGSASIRAAARRSAQRSIVLLKNDGDLLPLDPRGQRIALIGPFGADRTHLNGPWSFAGKAEESIDLATGMRAAMADPALLSVVAGSDIHNDLTGGIAAAVAAARAADVVLLAVGEGGDMSGEGNSRVDIGVPAAQMRLAEAVAATGKPVVVLLRHGRALALEGAIRDARAIVATWFLGRETGPAVAAMLFGRADPVGRLPVSFPLATGQQPWSYDRPSVGRPAGDGRARWRDAEDVALYPFGHGLAYTTFALSGLELPATMAWNGELTVSATVTNTGERAGEHVVQLYIRDRIAARTRPRRLLKRFLRVKLASGASERARFTLTRRDLEFVGPDGTWRAEPGAFDLWIAASSADPGLAGRFELTR